MSALVLSSGGPRGDARDASSGITDIDVDLVPGSSVSGLLGPFWAHADSAQALEDLPQTGG